MLNRDDILMTQQKLFGKYQLKGKSWIENGEIKSLTTPFYFVGKNLLISSEKREINETYMAPNEIVDISQPKIFGGFASSGYGGTGKIKNVKNGTITFTMDISWYGVGINAEISPNKSYILSYENLSNVSILARFTYYDKDYRYISNNDFNPLQIPQNSKYVIISFVSGSGTPTTISVSKIQLEEGNTATSYEKYIKRTFAPTTPLELRSAGTIYDTWNNTKNYGVRNVGSIKLKDLDYLYNDFGAFVATSINRKIHPFGDEANAISSCYSVDEIYDHTSGWQERWENKQVMLNHSNTNTWFRDDDYTDPTTFKNHFTDKDILNYELATPTIFSSESIMLPKGITSIKDKNGVEIEFSVID